MLNWGDTQFGLVGDKDEGPASVLFGTEFLSKLYTRSPPEVRMHAQPLFIFCESFYC